jgi:hypothetical protein
MINMQNILVTISMLAITFFVPAVVWATLIAGLLQLVHNGVRRLGGVLPSSRRLAQKSAR